MISAIINAGKVKNYDLLIISSPPLFTGLIGIFIKKLYKKDFWLDVRDLWPDSAFELDQMKKGVIFNFGKFLERKIYKNAKGFIFPVPSFRKYFSKFPSEISSKPMIELMNGVSRKFIDKTKINIKDYDEKFTVLYSGNMGLAQDLKTIIEAAVLLSDHDIFFEFIGDGVCKSEVQNLANKSKIKVNFRDSKPRGELIKSIMKSSSLCCSIKK